MKFTWLLFDMDNTLMDFTKASKQAFWQTFKDFDKECTEASYQLYQSINHDVWSAFEQGKITAELLRVRRMAMLLEAIQEPAIAPENFSKQYLENLVLQSELYPDTALILASLQEHYTLSLVTNGLKEVQRPRLKRLDLLRYFNSVIVSDEIGVAKPSEQYFRYVYSSILNPPSKSEILIIGDSIHSDILGGLNFGIKTCWVNHGKPNETAIQPDFEIRDIRELSEILRK